MSYHGATSNLRKHLKIHGKDIEESSDSQKSSPAPSCVSSCSSRSTIDTLLTDYTSLQSGSKRAAVTNSIAIMLVKDNLPLNHVNGEGFRYFMKTIVPNYQAPDRKTIKHNIEKLFHRMKEFKKDELCSIKSISLTFDIRKDTQNNNSYLGVTGHYVKEWKIRSILLSCLFLRESHTSANILMSLDEVLEEWNLCKSKVVACVTGSGSNVKKAVKDWIDESKHITCFAHSLNLVVKKSIEDVGNFKEILLKVRSIVQYFKQSGPAADELRRVQPEDHFLKVKQDVETRWNSSYLMLTRYIEIQDHINVALSHLSGAPSIITGSEREVIKDSLKIHKPFFSFTEEMSAEKVVTLSKVIPVLYCLLSLIKKLSLQISTGIFLQEALTTNLEKRFLSTKNHTVAVAATILHPRFKNLNIQSPTAVANALSLISKLIPTSPSQPQEETPDESDEHDVWRLHDELANKRQHREPRTRSGLSSKLKSYLDAPICPRRTDPLEYWSQVKTGFWELAELAPQYLAIPATSVPSERLFSKAGATMTERRNRLKPETLNMILFLNSLSIDESKSLS